MYIVLPMCCPSGAPCSYLYKGGGGLAPGGGGLIFPPASGEPGKKDLGNYMEWKGHKSYNTSCYIYKNIMLKKLVKLLVCQKNQKNFQAQNIFAKSDRGKNFIGHIRLTFPFRPWVLLEKKTLFDYLRFSHIPTVILIIFNILLIRFFH